MSEVTGASAISHSETTSTVASLPGGSQLELSDKSCEKEAADGPSPSKKPKMVRLAPPTRVQLPTGTHHVYTVSGRGELGRGSFGAVHRGWHDWSRLPVAVKFSEKAEETERSNLRKEGVALAAVGFHQNLRQVFQHITSDPVWSILVLELCDGPTLADKRTVEQLRRNELVANCVCDQMIAAVLFVHSKDWSHRDIKPRNFVLHGLIVKLIDFGLATQEETSTERCGSTAYMAPEVRAVTDLSPYNCKKADIWSLGCTINQTLLGLFCGAKVTPMMRPVADDREMPKGADVSYPTAEQATSVEVVNRAIYFQTLQGDRCDGGYQYFLRNAQDVSNYWLATHRLFMTQYYAGLKPPTLTAVKHKSVDQPKPDDLASPPDHPAK